MEATVIVGRISLFATDSRMRTNSPARMRQKSAARIEAPMHEVPEAESQLKLNFAAYGVDPATTGGMRRISLCRPGQANVSEPRFSSAVIGGYPHASTNTTSSAYGI